MVAQIILLFKSSFVWFSCRRKAMKGRLYFTTKSQKEGRIMIKTHPCAQIFCCDLCGFEQVQCNIVIGSYIVFMTVNNIIVMVNNTQFVSFCVVAPPQVRHWGPLHTNFSCLLLSTLVFSSPDRCRAVLQ